MPTAHDAAAQPSLPARIQARLARLYQIDAPGIDAFVRESEEGRETVAVRKSRGALELAVYLPSEALQPTASLSLDVFCQVVEGVSHFLYLIERARRRLPATQLELELQAEVDKYIVVAASAQNGNATTAPRRLQQRLFERIAFLHPEGSVEGARYRLANRLASRFVRTLDPGDAYARDDRALRVLRRFFGAGQREKLEMALAA